MHRRKLGIVFWLSVAWILILVFLALFANLLPIRDPLALGIRTGEVERFESPGSNAWFGGDGQGRDMFSIIVFGVRPALLLGLIATTVAATLGTIIGLTSGYLRGAVDGISTTLIDIALAFPGLVLLIAVRSTFGNSLLVFIILFSITGIPTYARIVRGAAMALSEREFVDAAVAMGATRARVIAKELAPNILMPVLAFAFLGFAIVIITEGALAFLGLSLDQETWGKLIAQGSGEIRNNPHVAMVPATVMFLTILAFNLVGDGIRTLYSPRDVVTRRSTSTTSDVVPLAELPQTHSSAALSIANLSTTLHTEGGDVKAVDGVTLQVQPGEALGIVGESGSGKTMILRSIVGAFALSAVTRDGSVRVVGTDMFRSTDHDIKRVLGTEIGMVSQNPLTALNPVRRIEAQIIEPMTVHGGLSKETARTRALELMNLVGIPAPEQRLREYPHQLSGGMRQRVTIAIALANEPSLLLADEPTTALDVTVQDQILRLLSNLQKSERMAMLLVTHDLAVVKGFTDRVAIVYAGQVVESGSTEEIFENPKHRYTVALMQSMPDLDLPSHSALTTIEGTPPSLIDLPEGCRFANRCPAAQQICRDQTPSVSGTNDHEYRCHFPAESVAVVTEAPNGR